MTTSGLLDAAPLVIAVLGAAGWWYAASRPVVGRVAARLDRPLAAAALALLAVSTVLEVTVLPDGITGWLLLAGALPAVPCPYGAWRLLRR